jgi:hypothetical protein
VLIVCGIIFAYYINDLRRDTVGGAGAKSFAIVVSVIVLAGIVGGFFIIGSPFTQRLRLFDERRVNDLQNIQWQVINYWQKKAVLPAKVSDLNDSISGYSVPSDPETSASYDYVVSGTTSFKLCAVFDLSTADVNSKDYLTKDQSGNYYSSGQTSVAPMYRDSSQNNWIHEKGRTCFDRKIDSQLYPPIIK